MAKINPVKIKQDADKEEKAGRFDKAIALYRQILDENPRDWNTINKVGDLYARVNRFREASEEYAKVADFYAKDGFLLKAIAIWKKINKLDASSLEPYLNLAELYSKQGLMMEAKSQYQIVVDEYVKRGRTREAADVLRKMAEIDSADLKVRSRLADIYTREGDTARAVQEHIAIAEELGRKGHLTEAVQVLEKGIKIDPRHTRLRAELAKAYIAQKNFDKAAQLLEGAASGAGEDAGTLTQLGEAYLATNRVADAERVFARLLELNPASAETRVQLARLSLVKGDYDRAYDELLPLVDRLVERAEQDKAAAMLQQILQKSPGHVRTLVKLVEVHRLQKNDRAVAATYSQLTESYIKAGQLESAASVLEILVSMEPQNQQHASKLSLVRGRLSAAPAEEEITPVEEEYELARAAPAQAVQAPLAIELSGPPSEEDKEFIEEHLAEGKVFRKYGLIDKAADQFEAIVARFPDHVETRQELLDVYKEKALPAKAAEQALALAQIYRLLGDLEAAEAAMLEARGLAPEMVPEGLGAAVHLEVEEMATAEPAPEFEAEEALPVGPALEEEPAAEAEPGFPSEAPAPEPAPPSPPPLEVEEAAPAEAEAALLDLEAQPIDLALPEAEAAAPSAGAEALPAAEAEAEEEIPLEVEEGGLEEESLELGAGVEEELPVAELQPEAGPEEGEPEEIPGELPLEPGAVEPALELGAADTEGAEVVDLGGPIAQEGGLEPEIGEAGAEAAGVGLEAGAPVAEDEFPPAPAPAEETAPAEPPAPLTAPAALALEPARAGMPSEPEALGSAIPADLERALSEVEEYVSLGFIEDAKEALREAMEHHPQHPAILEKVAALGMGPTALVVEAEEGVPPAPPAAPPSEAEAQLLAARDESTDRYAPVPETLVAPPPPEAPVPSPAEPASLEEALGELAAGPAAPGPPARFAEPVPPEEGIDLGAELGVLFSTQSALEEAPPAASSTDLGDVGLAEIFKEFKKGVDRQLGKEDYDTRYNLGIAYKEMGLLDEAIAEFQLAAKDDNRLLECSSMLGICFMEKGMPKLAVKWFEKGLAAPGRRDEEYQGLRYDLAQAHEASGETDRALGIYIDLYGQDANFRDVAAKVKELRAARG